MPRVFIVLIMLLIPALNIVSPVIGAGMSEVANSNPEAMPAYPAGTRYVVRNGDTLYDIARANSLDMDTLAALNQIENVRLIREGQVLLLPGAPGIPVSNVETEASPVEVPAGTTSQYVIQAGDTLYDLARANGTDVDTLIALNNLENPRFLRVGDVISLPAPSASINRPVPTATPLPAEPAPQPEPQVSVDVAPVPVAAPVIDTAVIIALDTSESMAGIPLARTKDAVRQLMRALNGRAEVGLVTFGGKAQVAQPLTTELDLLTSALSAVQASGETALYDGGFQAVTQAALSDTAHRFVVILSDGVEADAKITATADADDALTLAQAENISIITVSLGLGVDRTYLDGLAEGTHAPVYQTPGVDGLAGIFTSIATAISDAGQREVASASGVPLIVPPMSADAAVSTDADELARSLGSVPLDTTDNSAQVRTPGNWGELLNLPIPGENRAASASERAAGEGIIPPLDDGVSELDFTLDGAPASQAEAPAEAEAAPAPAPAVVDDGLMSNLVPISISVPLDADIDVAELAINGYRLHTFNGGPYIYDLDTNMLTEGLYSLTFTVANRGGVVSAGTLDFEVQLQRPALAADESAATLGKSIPTAGTGAANRVLLVDGREIAFDLEFSTAGGLKPVQPVEALLVPPAESVIDILRQPVRNLIPESVWQQLTMPRPREAAIVVLLMTLSLLPQGIFTLYWMMYAWNNPEAARRDQAPREFSTPQLSFTALLPARHEEEVIKDTIYAVDRLDYPDELKEVLILCRDDDQGTIAKANEAVEELGKSNIRVVTFSTGPINKPHALNIGLEESTKDVVCIFDAEDEPHPALYNVINTVMLRDDADVVQSGVQLMNFRSTWFSALNVLEYFFWFKSGLKAFTRQLHVTPLGGNTVFFKKGPLEAIGGWDEACLTEDADVGIRLTLAGAKIQIVYEAEYATQEETPHNVESFIKQRTRWCQGFYQIFLKGDWARLPTFTQKVTAIYILLNSLMQAATLLSLPVGIYIALTQPIAVPVALLSYFPIFLLLLQMITNLIGIREFTDAYNLHLPFLFRLRMVIFYYPYQLMMAAAAARAVYRLVSQNHAWEKTAHSNLHRQGQVVQGRA